MILSALSFAGLLYLARIYVADASDSTGCIQLDEYNFDKLISRFEATVVKIDVAYPYGDKENAYVDLAKSARSSDDLLVACIGVKDYGDKENQELAKKYGVSKDDFPAVLLFLKGKEDPVSFPKEAEFTVDSLRKFVKDKSGIRITLNGCISELDKLASEFMKAKKEKRQSLLKTAENKIYTEKNKIDAHKVYIVLMQKILEKGNSFVNTEIERVKKLLKGKVSQSKEKELNLRLNILQAFELDTQKNEEL